MSHSVGYWVDLRGVSFDESSGVLSSWIQAMPLGYYDHPLYGEIDFSPERIQRFADSVNGKVRGTDLDIDYDHKMATGEAAGWIKQAEARTDGLWVLVEWTKTAYDKIKEGVYRYFSPEYDDEWEHPKTGATFKDVLFGGGITNRPFLKDILPLNLSELIKDQTQPKQPAHQGGGTIMATTKKFGELSIAEQATLAGALGLPDTASAADVQGTLKALSESAPAGGSTGDTGKEGTGSAGTGSEGGTGDTGAAPEKKSGTRMTDDPDYNTALLTDVARLAGDNPAMRVLSEVMEGQERELSETRAALRLAEANSRIAKLNETALKEKRSFPPAIEEGLRAILIKSPKALAEEVFAVLHKMAEVGFINLGELGKNYRGGASPGISLDARARKLMTENKDLTYPDAIVEVTRQDPNLAEDYRVSTMGGE